MVANEKEGKEQVNNWIELHRHFSNNWQFRSEMSWETLKQNMLISSALTSLAVYSIIYVYTSEFFWETEAIISFDRLFVRVGLMVIPLILLFVNLMFHTNFRRQCRRMYLAASIVIKIEEEMGLYGSRRSREYFRNDKWYVPDEWKKQSHCSAESFVKVWMDKKDGFYQQMLWLFRIFGALAIVIVVIEIFLLFIHPY